MTTPGSYPSAQSGQVNQNAIIAATPGDPLGEALAGALRNLGWRAVVTDQIAAYAREARICVAVLTPSSVNSPVIAAALSTPVAALIPLVVGPTQQPSGPWATQPVIFAGDPGRAAQEITAAANSLGSASGTFTGASAAPSAPSGGYETPGAGTYAGAPTPQPPQPGIGGTVSMPAPQPPVYQPGASYPTQAGPAPVGYNQYAQGAAPYMAPPTAPKKRSRWPLIVGGIVALALVLCIAAAAILYPKVAAGVKAAETQTAQAGATATPLATATPNIPANFTQYTDTAGGFSIAYPNTWQKSTASGEMSLLDEADTADLVIGVTDTNISQSDVTSAEASFFKNASPTGTYNNLQGPTTVSYAGESWTKETADISISGETLVATVLVANHGTRAYIIGYLAPKQNFSNLDQQAFQPILNSITFLS